MIKHSLKLSQNRAIHQYWGRASNIYLIEDHKAKETLMIDCGLPSDVKGLIDVLDSMPPIKRVVCTHYHVDHAAGWIQLKEVFRDCDIWLHENARPFVTGHERIPYPSLKDWFTVLIPCMKEYSYFPDLAGLFRGGLYGTPFKKKFPEDRVHFFGNNQQILPGFDTIYTPGHRPDSVSFYEQDSGVFVSGDFLIVLNGVVVKNPFVTSQEDQDSSLSKIKQIKGITHIYPGHGICRPFSADIPDSGS